MVKYTRIIIGSLAALVGAIGVVSAQTPSNLPPPTTSAHYYYSADGTLPPHAMPLMRDGGARPPIAPALNHSASTPAGLTAKLRTDYEQKLNDARNNETYRNDMLDARYSSTSPAHPVPPRSDDRPPYYGTSTPGMMTDGHPTPNQENMKMYITVRFNGAVHELQTAIKNLQQIRGRINSRLEIMQSNGTDVNSLQSLLSTADAKITTAVALVSALAAHNPASTMSTTASSTPNLDSARQAMSAATKAIMDARKTLIDVVTAMVKISGPVTSDHEASTTRPTRFPPTPASSNASQQ
jgi:hypothetical protein